MELLSTKWGRALAAAVGALALGTVIGLVALWPDGSRPRVASAGGSSKAETVDAEVTASRVVDCGGPKRQGCRRLTIDVDGRRAALTLGPVATAPASSPVTTSACPRPRLHPEPCRATRTATWAWIGARL